MSDGAGAGSPWWRRFPWLKVTRVLGCTCGLVIIALGIYSFVMDSLDIELVVANIYRIIFGILIVIAELQFVKLLDWFSFLCTLIGLGGFYIFVGGLALGSDWYEITIAIVLVVIGLIYCMAGCTCQDDRPTAVDLKSGGSGQPATSVPPKQQQMQPPPNRQPQQASWPNMDEEAI